MGTVPGELDHFVVRGMRLSYHSFGPPNGRPLLCLHGFLDTGASFAFMAEHLPEFRIVAPDMRGHGHSEWVGAGGYYHFYDYYDDCRVLVSALGWSRFALLGHSMGGSIATGLAALEPEWVEALILFEGMGPPFTDPVDTPARLRRWSDALRKRDKPPADRRRDRRVMAGTADAAQRLCALNPRITPGRAAQLAEWGTEPAEGGVAWRHDPLHRTPSAKPFLREEAESLWGAVRAPVLSVQGSESGWMRDQLPERYAVLSSVIAATLAGAGHNIHHDQPERAADAVRAWLASTDHRPAALDP